MSRYYYLIAGLPMLTFEGGKPPFTALEFKEEAAKHLTKADARLFEFLQLKTDTKNLLKQLQKPDCEMINGGKITIDEINALISGVKAEYKLKKEIKEYNIEAEAYNKEEEENYKVAMEEYVKLDYYDQKFLTKKPQLQLRRFKKPLKKLFKNKNKCLPAYFEKFTRLYLTSVENGEEIKIPWDDRLLSMYYEYAMKRSNVFLSAWFECNLNINNIYTALTCRKYKLDRENYIVGDTEISNKLRTSTARDFELSETLTYLIPVLQIAEDPEILQREWRTNQIKWEWLDRQIFPNVFDLENVITYWLKIEMQEHWLSLDKAEGEKAFRQIVGPLKKSSTHILEEFKRNNKK